MTLSESQAQSKNPLDTKVLLIFHSSGDQKASIEVLPPLGILSIAAYLENKNIKTDVIDFTIEPDMRIDVESYDIIGFSINISNYKSSLAEIERIRKSDKNVPIIVGGPLCISSPEIFFNDNINAVFACEGEEALFEYITTENKEEVKGIYLKSLKNYVFTGERKYINDLDSLPFPALNKVDLSKYNNYPKRKLPISSIMTSRGCPYKCIFCSHTSGKKWRSRSPENVVEEIKWQVSEFGIKEILVFDDNFTLSRHRTEKICDLIIANKINIKIQLINGVRVDRLDYPLLEKLKKAGTWYIAIAPETGNQEVMKLIKKGFNQDKVLQIRKICRKLGIKTQGLFMIGFPFENKEKILQTIEFAKKLDCEIVQFSKVIPHPKTELYDMLVKDEGLLSPSHSAESYYVGGIKTHKVGDLCEEDIKILIRKAYRNFYIRPRKIIDLLLTFSIKDIISLSIYALRTRNI